MGEQFRPDQLAKLADKLADCLNPDGQFSDEDRARRRGLTLGKQDIDGMSPIRGWLTPAMRATVEAVLAKLAAPGMANPYDEKPVVDGTPAKTPCGTTRAAPRSVTTMGCTPGCARCWPAARWVCTTGCPPPSSCPRRWPS
ncbi:hypothetical protein I553_8134 [Mycobacterium xenopi 4042]|uniref:DUF222 domain-containing protein n=1 Tax=Mycobacterium xenopi 4042 TaxID=1299334 RepID=X8DCA0_MYCXE|nr:hypothetical protein I553_8134 [Mycobacterium xenopi 4042]